MELGRADAPTRRRAFAGLDPCVHCGFCLPACPTYEVTADESDSPRGRIVLMRALARGTASAHDAALAVHLDRCLGCRACESVCPSGVSYGPALEAARDTLARARGVPALVRVALWILAIPARQRLLWRIARMLRGTGLPRSLAFGAGAHAPRLAGMMGMVAATKQSDWRTGGPADGRTGGPADGKGRALPTGSPPVRPTALFRGCIMDGLFGHVHDATIAALRVNGVRATEVPGQVCCGALAAHAGEADLARALARRNVRAFDTAAPGQAVVVNSAGCGAMLKAYGDWLAGDPLADRARALAARVFDVSEVLAERGPAPARPLPLRVAYDAPCHLQHAQHVTDPPLRLLAAIPGLVLVPLEGSDRCCGSAGLYSLVEPALSRDVLAVKLDAIAAAAPDVVATGNPGCLMQIGAGLLERGSPIAVCHPVELLARAYRP